MDVISNFHRRDRPLPRLSKDPGPADWEEIQQFRTMMRIEARARRVLEEVLVLGIGNVTQLTVVGHSQGSVIAILSLYLKWTKNMLSHWNIRKRNTNLVTMGSPFTHLYQKYFPRRYPPLFINGNFNKNRWYELNETVGNWINVYRADDFVGKEIDGDNAGFPENRPIPIGGHVDYWNNQQVLGLIRRYLPG